MRNEKMMRGMNEFEIGMTTGASRIHVDLIITHSMELPKDCASRKLRSAL